MSLYLPSTTLLYHLYCVVLVVPPPADSNLTYQVLISPLDCTPTVFSVVFPYLFWQIDLHVAYYQTWYSQVSAFNNSTSHHHRWSKMCFLTIPLCPMLSHSVLPLFPTNIPDHSYFSSLIHCFCCLFFTYCMAASVLGCNYLIYCLSVLINCNLLVILLGWVQ